MDAPQEDLVKLERALKRCRRIAEKVVLTEPLVSPSVVASLMMDTLGNAEQEELWVLHCDTRNRLIRKVQVYRGSLNASAVRMADVFREAVRDNSASLIVVHNHPSGDAAPSPEDTAVTRAMVEAGKLLDIEVLDHVVIGRGAYTSFKAKGMVFA